MRSNNQQSWVATQWFKAGVKLRHQLSLLTESQMQCKTERVLFDQILQIM